MGLPETIMNLKPGVLADELVSKIVMKEDLYVREVHVCPDCGWETESLEVSSRCQACWANDVRVTMDDKETVWDFKPSIDLNTAFKVMNKINTSVYRQNAFLVQLEKVHRSQGKEYISWPNALFNLKSIDICKAAILMELEESQ